MKIRASVSLMGFSLITPSCTTTFMHVNTKFEIVRDAWNEFDKYKVLVKEILETWSDVIKRVGLLSDLLLSCIAIFAKIASACKISVSSELRTYCLFQTVWEKLWIAVAEQLLEQIRHSQAMRSLSDSSRKNGFKE